MANQKITKQSLQKQLFKKAKAGEVITDDFKLLYEASGKRQGLMKIQCESKGGKWVNGKCSGQVREGKKKYPGLTPYSEKE